MHTNCLLHRQVGRENIGLHQNKMNKKAILTRFKPINEPSALRVIFKKRNNHRQRVELSASKSPSQLSCNSSRITPALLDEPGIQQVKRYVRKRLNTEYSAKYQGLQSSFRCSTPNNSGLNRSQLDVRVLKTVDCHDSQQLEHEMKTSRHLVIPDDTLSAVDSQSGDILELKGLQKIGDLEEEIDNALQSRIKRCLELAEVKGWKEENKMEHLISAIRKMKEDQNPESNLSTDFSDKKIRMVDKLLAENAVESDILKKYYFNKITRPMQHKSSSLQSIQLSRNRPGQIKKNDSFISMSESKRAYSRPKVTDFAVSQKRRGALTTNNGRTPFPVSSYKRQFLGYRGKGTFPESKPSDCNVLKTAGSLRHSSSYRYDFLIKKAERINPKSLDACRNKFKDLPVVFGRKQKEPGSSKLYRFLNINLQTALNRQNKSVPFAQSSLITQSKRQFIKNIVAPPVHYQHSQKLKYQMRSRYRI